MLSTDATQGATPATTAASGWPSPLMKPWLVGLAAIGLTIGVVALAASGNKKKKNGRNNPRKGKRQKPGADNAYRAWYRDSPAEAGPAGHDRQYRRPATFADQVPTGAPYADLRYSDQNSRRIESQYP
ncbi:hypothetical protein BEN47_11535 [Hymenobacter lapidarius]|uniref:Uncharacterized protein n=1 Tax=Hymenobacter lapidarius TaxID=1908237 RepID=A0A1G1T8U2_9BACT|nr:hypothetical protein [Hymenobacter lapidarius]OGX87288.1 hypothetical protein BEN47_11535 [Hymenobacter lapidarius]